MVIKKFKWKRKPIALYGEPGERKFKAWVLVEEMDRDDELTMVKALSDKMDWFINVHGGPMIDTHSNAVVGHWENYGFGVHPEVEKKAMWIEGVVHRGPDGGPFPAADIFWNELKAGNVKGLSWGGTKMEGFAEYDSVSGKFLGNTIEDLIPHEISGVRSTYPTQNGMPPSPAVEHATLMELDRTVKMQGMSDEEMQVPPEEWIRNCADRMGFMGGRAPAVCAALYNNDIQSLKEFFGTPFNEAEIEFKLLDLRSRGEIPLDAKEAVKDCQLAQDYVVSRAINSGSDEGSLADLQRVLSGKVSQKWEDKTMEEHEKKEMADLKSQVSILLEQKRVADIEAQKVTDQKSLADSIKTSIEETMVPYNERVTALENSLKEAKTKKEDDEEEEEEKEEEEPKDEKKELTSEQKAELDTILEKEKKAFFDGLDVVETPDPGAGGSKKTFDPAAWKKASRSQQKEMTSS